MKDGRYHYLSMLYPPSGEVGEDPGRFRCILFTFSQFWTFKEDTHGINLQEPSQICFFITLFSYLEVLRDLMDNMISSCLHPSLPA